MKLIGEPNYCGMLKRGRLHADTFVIAMLERSEPLTSSQRWEILRTLYQMTNDKDWTNISPAVSFSIEMVNEAENLTEKQRDEIWRVVRKMSRTSYSIREAVKVEFPDEMLPDARCVRCCTGRN